MKDTCSAKKTNSKLWCDFPPGRETCPAYNQSLSANELRPGGKVLRNSQIVRKNQKKLSKVWSRLNLRWPKRNNDHTSPSFNHLLQGGFQRGNVRASRTLNILWFWNIMSITTLDTSSKESQKDKMKTLVLLAKSGLLQDLAKVSEDSSPGVDQASS